MLVLGIETSCDETAVAVGRLSSDGRFSLLAEHISSQIDLHRNYGGVVPELASREHLSNLPLVLSHTLEQSGVSFAECDAIAATRGPGLKGCLLVGFGFAKALAIALKRPFIGVNHLEGHIVAAMLDADQLRPPFVALLVSGGHTELVLVRAFGDYKVINRTSDDAAGEAFDKSAHLLGFGYPGGARLAALADTVSSSRFSLPRPAGEGARLSFSGLKTAIANLVMREAGALAAEPIVRAEIAWSIQEAIVDQLIARLKEVLAQHNLRTVVVTGGVAANRRLRARVLALPGVDAFFPALQHSTDNAAMIAYAGALRLARGERGRFGDAALAQWPLETIGGVDAR